MSVITRQKINNVLHEFILSARPDAIDIPDPYVIPEVQLPFLFLVEIIEVLGGEVEASAVRVEDGIHGFGHNEVLQGRYYSSWRMYQLSFALGSGPTPSWSN